MKQRLAPSDLGEAMGTWTPGPGATSGDDTYVGDDSDDSFINGLDGNDTLSGAGGDDSLNGGNGDDTLTGGAYDDVIDTGNGNNHVYGGAGNDIIKSSGGQDTLSGGLGNDAFVVRAGEGNDTVTDFSPNAVSNNDVIDLIGFGASFDTFAEVMAAASQNGSDVVIDFDAGQHLTLQNLNLGDLTAADFIFGG
jgi:Ca2+-binding RTX toxin-like protein